MRYVFPQIAGSYKGSYFSMAGCIFFFEILSGASGGYPKPAGRSSQCINFCGSTTYVWVVRTAGWCGVLFVFSAWVRGGFEGLKKKLTCLPTTKAQQRVLVLRYFSWGRRFSGIFSMLL